MERLKKSKKKTIFLYFFTIFWSFFGNLRVWGAANQSAASAASRDYVKFQAVIKSAASAASLQGGRASGRLDHAFFLYFLAALAAKK